MGTVFGVCYGGLMSKSADLRRKQAKATIHKDLVVPCMTVQIETESEMMMAFEAAQVALLTDIAASIRVIVADYQRLLEEYK